MTEPATTADLLLYLSRPMTPPSQDVQIMIERGPIAVADALLRTQLDRLLDPAPLARLPLLPLPGGSSAGRHVRTTTDQAVVRDFIRRYHDSTYVADAKRRLDALVVAEQERKEKERLAAIEAKRQKMEADAVAAWNSIKSPAPPLSWK